MIKIMIYLAIMITMAVAQAEVYLDEMGSASLDDATIIRMPNITIEFMNSSYNFTAAYDVGENFYLELHNLTSAADISLFSIHFRQPPAQLARHALIIPDQSGFASYRSDGLPSGEYLLLVTETNQSSYRIRLPILVQDELHIDVPDKLTAGQALALSLRRSGNLSNHAVGCLFMPLRDYDRINVTFMKNLRINIGNLSASLGGVSPEEVMKVLAIFPRNCAVAVDSEADSQTKLNLITEEDWEKGDYMLLGASYSQQSISLVQKVIEVQ